MKVGEIAPDTAPLYPVPSVLYSEVPKLKDHRFFADEVTGTIILVRPLDNRISRQPSCERHQQARAATVRCSARTRRDIWSGRASCKDVYFGCSGLCGFSGFGILASYCALAPLAGFTVFRPQARNDALHARMCCAQLERIGPACELWRGGRSEFGICGGNKCRGWRSPRAAVTPFFRIVFITFFVGASIAQTALWRIRQKGAVTAVTKTPRVRSPGLAGPPSRGPNYPWNEWP